MSPATFVFPSQLEDLELEAARPDQLLAQNPVDGAALRPADLEDLVRSLVFDLSDRDLCCVQDQDVFDRLYSSLRAHRLLPASCRSALVETLRSNLFVLLPNLDSLARRRFSLSPGGVKEGVDAAERASGMRNALRIYTFFLLSVVLAEEGELGREHQGKGGAQSRKKNATKTWNWEPMRGKILGLIANSLEINFSLLFGSSDPDENYLSFVSKCVFSLYENQTLLRDSNSREGLSRIVGAISTKHKWRMQSCASILHLLYKFDFAVLHLADAICAAEKKYGDGSLAVGLIREIGRTDPKEYVRDAAGAENVGRFLVEVADRSPKLMATNVGILVPHFGGESYKIRNALVSVLGKLAAKAFKDVDGDLSSKSVRLRGKQAMLEILLERCRDVSAYTRSRVLQVWSELCEEHAISIAHWNEVASVAAGRLEDKSAIVRKSALGLLLTMLQHNPFGPQLRVAAFEATLAKYKEELQQMQPSEASACASDGANVGPEAELQQSASDSCLTSTEVEAEEEARGSDIGSLEQTRILVASLEAGLRFSSCITSIMPTLVQLLASSSSSDVENTILLLMRCRQFQIDGSEGCLRKMLPLAFSLDKSISEVVEDAFVTIYVRKIPAETARNLVNLAVESNVGDLTALEFLISTLMSKGEISTSTITTLWDFFGFNVNGITVVESRGALSVLFMAAKSSPQILSSHLQDIVDIGFGRWAKVDPLLARTALAILERLSKEDRDRLMSNSGNKVFSFLYNLITGYSFPDNIWYTAAEKAISTIYSLHPEPEAFAVDVIKKSLENISEFRRTAESADHDLGNTDLPVSKLGRFLFVCSHVALRHLIFVESCVRKIQKQKSNQSKSMSEGLDGDDSSAVKAGKKEDAISTELGLAASEDVIIDGLFERTEKEIVSGASLETNIIGDCATFISKLCRNYTIMQKHPELQSSAMLALCKLMIVDAEFCEANLQLLFTVVESSPSDTVRSNCTLALGDLAVRFPNLLEPWTENMYARLRDPSASVRKNAVLVLSHLILNDMMKVKGYINEMALCLEDEDERISSLARLFFHELSKKGNNPIYNLLPDILGRLFNQNLKEEAFCNIIQFLLNSIKKDRQMEALVEKLCNRFSGVSDVRQWEHISYCLSQLTFTEKGLKKLIDSLKIFEHTLSEDSVMDNFRNIISKGKKFAKAELKSVIEEFEEKLNNIHLEKKEQEKTTKNALEHQKRVGNPRDTMSFEQGLEDKEENKVEDETSEVVDPSEGSGISKAGRATPESSNSTSSDGNKSCVTESEVSNLEVQSSGLTKRSTRKKKVTTVRTHMDGGFPRKTRSSKR